MKKLPFVSACALACCALVAATPPWKAIYSNDTTNIFNCHSPANPQGDPDLFDEKMLRASVAEAAVQGMGAQLLQPGHGWIAWWPSKLVPLDEHEKWFKQTFGNDPDIAVHRYLLAGGDLLGIFIDECHKHGNAALISYRMNDAHHLEWTVKGNAPGYTAHANNKFYSDHPQYRMAPPPATDGRSRVHNWLHKGARDYKLALLREITEVYPQMDGFELDWMRYPHLFPDGTAQPKRNAIMLEFIKEVRGLLDALEKTDGKHRWLGVRIPTDPKAWPEIGLNPKTWQDAGVEFFNISPSYETTEQTGVAELRKAAPDARIYAELTHCTQRWRFGYAGYDAHMWRRSTKEILENSATVAYARGADGVSFFNFAYYRGHGEYQDLKGPFNEPPFELIPTLADKDALRGIPGYFYLDGGHAAFNDKEKKRSYEMDILPANGNAAATLRVQVLGKKEKELSEREPPEAIDRGKWRVVLNGKALEFKGLADKNYPFPTPYKAGFGHAQQYLCFDVPTGLLKNGKNTLVLEKKSGPDLYLRWLEIVQPAR